MPRKVLSRRRMLGQLGVLVGAGVAGVAHHAPDHGGGPKPKPSADGFTAGSRVVPFTTGLAPSWVAAERMGDRILFRWGA